MRRIPHATQLKALTPAVDRAGQTASAVAVPSAEAGCGVAMSALGVPPTS